MKTCDEELSSGARGFASITSYLMADHARLDRLLAGLRSSIASGAIFEAVALHEKLERGLRRHIRLEETIVFPLFEERTRIGGPVAVMKVEHRQIEALLERTRAALAEAGRARLTEAAGELATLIAQHNLKEERILYPKTDQALTPDERRELAARLERS